METRESRKWKDDGVGDGSPTLHAVFIPHPVPGHVTPALQLAKKLAKLGFRITFVNAVHGERMAKSRSKAMEPQ